MICKKCGTQLDDNAVYCYNCGYIFEKPREPQPGANFAPPVNIQPIGQPKKKASIWYTVIIPITAVLVVIAIVSGLYVGGVFNGGNSWQIEVPDVVGKAYDKASTTLEKKNLHCLISDKVENADVDENNVLSQDPSAKTVAGKGSIVDVVLSAGAGKIYMPDIENYSKDYAKDILTAQGFEVEFRDAKGDCEKYAPDSVCDYSLENGQGVYKGETVIVYVKSEEEKQTSKYSMPKIVGMDFDDAQDKLYSDGIYISIEKYEYNDRIPENQIVAQSVNENEQVDKGSTVYVTVSLGKEKVFMPDVAFTTEENAKKILEECGLKVKIEEEENQYVAKGTVIKQKDAPGTQIEKGTEVTIIVSSGYTVAVPDVVGLNEKDAISRIIESGLAVNVVYEYDINKAQKTVTAQDKQANEKVQLGTAVTITVNSEKNKDRVSVENDVKVDESINKSEEKESAKIKYGGMTFELSENGVEEFFSYDGKDYCIGDNNNLYAVSSTDKEVLSNQYCLSYIIVNDIIYYSAVDKLITAEDLNLKMGEEVENPSECSMWKMNLDGTDKEKLFNFIGFGYPIYVDDSNVYYSHSNLIQYFDDSDSYSIQRYNVKDKKIYPIAGEDKYNYICYSNGNIFYRLHTYFGVLETSDTYRYDIKSNKSYNMNIKTRYISRVDDETVALISYDLSASTTTIYEYDTTANQTQSKVFNFVGFPQVRNNTMYIMQQDNNHSTYYRYLKGGKTEKIYEFNDFVSSCFVFENKTVFTKDSSLKYLSNGVEKTISNTDGYISGVGNNSFRIKEYNSVQEKNTVKTYSIN